MKLFAKHFIKSHQTKLFFLVIWLHVSLLDFLYVSYRGPVFLYKESVQLNTLLTHVSIALLTLACYFLVTKLLDRRSLINSLGNVDPKVTDKTCE